MSRASPRERNTTRFRKTSRRLGGLTVIPFGTFGRITANNRRIIHFGVKCNSPPQSIGALPMTRFAREVGTLALAIILTAATASAQLATAELNGRVADSSGAVLPGVTVTATQTATGLVRNAVTDESGAYLVSNLPPGPYRLEFSLQGFRSYVQTGLVLTVGATPTINAALALGSLEETITVEAAAPLVDVRSAGISQVIENERIVELPLQGRQVTD